MTSIDQQTKPSSLSRVLTVTVVCIFLFCLVGFLLQSPTYFLRDGDTFWHIRTGQWILDNWKLPTKDFYSYTAMGARWIDGEWLSDIGFALAYNVSGWRGVSLVTIISGASIIAILARCLLERLRFSVALGLTAVSSSIVVNHFLARPHIFSYVLLPIWVLMLLDQYDRKRFDPPVVPLGTMMVLWVNLHGSFTLGLGILWIFAGCALWRDVQNRDSAHAKSLLIRTLTISSCALVNPYGIYAAWLTLDVSQMSFVLKHGGEWRVPPWQELELPLVMFIFMLIGPIALGVRITGPRWGLLFLLCFLGMLHFRGLFMFFLLAPIAMAASLAGSSRWLSADTVSVDEDIVLSFIERWGRVLIASLTITAFFVLAARWDRLNVSTPAPVAAVDFVEKAGISGHVFNSPTFGGYLIFRGIPVFIDSRNPPYDDRFTKLQFETERAYDIDKALQTLDAYKVKWLFLIPSAPLGKIVARLGTWKLRYSDDHAVVYVRE